MIQRFKKIEERSEIRIRPGERGNEETYKEIRRSDEKLK